MKLAHNIKILSSITVIVSLSACMVDPVESNYTPTVAGYQSGSLSSTSLASNAATTTGASTSSSTSYSSLTQAETPIIRKGALLTASPIAAPARLNSAQLVGTPTLASAAPVHTSSNGVPVTIYTPVAATSYAAMPIAPTPYGSLNATDQQVIRPNVFGMPQQVVPVYGQPVYGQR